GEPAGVTARRLVFEVPSDLAVLDVRVDEHRRREHGVGVRRSAQRDAVLGLDTADLGNSHGVSLPGGPSSPCRLRRLQSVAGQRYCPVVTRSICRPPPLPSSSARSVRTNTMRSPFLPEIFAQSSGFVVFGRSSCSLYSWRIAAVRSSLRIPGPSPAIARLIESFLARRTMFSIMAPDEKSLKYRTSLSPFWYVT